ncbi:hypothetical protein O181_002126 [Austropuccinia psidii MF-1]|uniref:Uncharacterized protein n=1 Tax=Austropuccinia psidii MF-1 TaxID=1389203 RepID=A0A9Q3BCE8_9BASI|nr:hypothetical protein [Austropuccinia psidii MF-1]
MPPNQEWVMPVHLGKSFFDYEDEKMSQNQSETNCEPRRNNFMAHDNETQAKSEFTHPQMPIDQIMLYQSEMSQKRNQACKYQNLVKNASQKEQKRCQKAEFPDNVNGMRSGVHTHCLFLLKVKDKDFYSLPAQTSFKLKLKSLVISDMFPKIFQ